MDFDVLDSFDDLGCIIPLGESKLKDMLDTGPKSLTFTQVVEWFSKELQCFCSLDSCVNAITDPSESSVFLLEVSTFLKEMKCPYKCLTAGLVSQRLLDVKSRCILLDYLCTELQSARIVHFSNKSSNALEITMETSDIAASLNRVQKVLNIKPTDNSDAAGLFSEMQEKIQQQGESTKPILSESLSEAQWDALDTLYKDYLHEYTVRRELLLTRLDVTLQSFRWGEGSKVKEKSILNAFVNKRANLKKSPAVKLPDLLSADESLLVVEKTSSARLVKNTKSSLNRVLIPPVPDRGGRPGEQRPPMEMPNWRKRSDDGGGRGRGGFPRQQKQFQRGYKKR